MAKTRAEKGSSATALSTFTATGTPATVSSKPVLHSFLFFLNYWYSAGSSCCLWCPLPVTVAFSISSLPMQAVFLYPWASLSSFLPPAGVFCAEAIMSSLSTALLTLPLIFPKQVYGLLFCTPWGCPSKNARSLVIQSPLAHGVPPISSVNKAKSALTLMKSMKQEGKLTQGPPGVSVMHKNHQISYSHLLRLLTVVYFKYYENDNELVSAATNFKSSYKHLLPSFVYL